MSYSQLGEWQPWSNPEFEEFLKAYYSRRLIIAGHIAPDDDAARLIIFEKIASPSVYLEREYTKWKTVQASATSQSVTTTAPPPPGTSTTAALPQRTVKVAPPTTATTPQQQLGTYETAKQTTNLVFADLPWHVGSIKNGYDAKDGEPSWIFADQHGSPVEIQELTAILLRRIKQDGGTTITTMRGIRYNVMLQEEKFIQRRPVTAAQEGR